MKYSVSVFCECFATVEVEATNKEEAMYKALASASSDFTVQQYTIKPIQVEENGVTKK